MIGEKGIEEALLGAEHLSDAICLFRKASQLLIEKDIANQLGVLSEALNWHEKMYCDIFDELEKWKG